MLEVAHNQGVVHLGERTRLVVVLAVHLEAVVADLRMVEWGVGWTCGGLAGWLAQQLPVSALRP